MSRPAPIGRPDPTLSPRPQPFLVCAAPGAEPLVRQMLDQDLIAGAQLFVFEQDRAPVMPGPNILVLTPSDLRGPHRDKLMDLALASRPGRPVLYGGMGNRQTLLDAINTWRVFRVVPESPRPVMLADAIRKAQETLELEVGLEHAAAELRGDTTRLEEVLAELRDSQERTRHAERLATLGRITKSLIPVISSHLDALQDFNALVAAGASRRDARLEELLGYAFTGIRSLHAMLDEIRSYAESRSEVYHKQPVEADEMVRLAVAFSRYDPLASQRKLVADLRSRARIQADTFRLHQTIVNLVRNAFQATPEGGEVAVRTTADALHVTIDVENTGDPIPQEVQIRLFQPFFTTKGEEGMGLGLSLCRATVEGHGGIITCSSKPGSPTRFRIRLPRLQ
jgi:signal transduction histidine kinase